MANRDNLDPLTHKIMTAVLYGDWIIGLILILAFGAPVKWLPMAIHSIVILMASHSHSKYYSHVGVSEAAKKYLYLEQVLMFAVISFGMHDYEHIFLLLIAGDAIMAFPYRYGLLFTLGTYMIYYPYVEYAYPIIAGKPYGTNYVDDFVIVTFTVLCLFLAKYQTRQKVRYDVLLEERNNAYKELEKYADQIEDVAVHEERSRITLMLHNSLGHRLVATNMALQAEKMELVRKEVLAPDAFSDVEEGISKAMSLLRKTVEDEGDFILAMPFKEIMIMFIEDVASSTGVHIRYFEEGVDHVPDRLKRLTFNSVMESITNALKHADATNIRIRITCDKKQLEIIVEDDGKGFCEYKQGYGTGRLKEQIENLHGSYRLHSDGGCTMSAVIPLEG